VAGLRGTFRALDLRHLDMEGQFDGIINWGGSFGYFSDAENARLVEAYVRALRPGGRLLIEQPDREYILRHFQRVMQIGSTTRRNRWDARNQRVVTRWFGSGAEDRRNASSMRLYTPAQMRGLLELAGLIVDQVQRSVMFDAWGKSLPRMVTIGKKPVSEAD
jgi:SAM-dependent methyltransferase